MGEVMTPNVSSLVVLLHNLEGVVSNAQRLESVRTPDNLIRKAQPTTKQQERLLIDFSQLT
jgi:hypothetical protein